MLFKIFVNAAILFLSFRLLNWIQKLLPFAQKTKKQIVHLLATLEFLVWIGFIFKTSVNIYESGNKVALYVLLAILLIVVIPIYFLLRDYIFGLFLKIFGKINVKDSIEFDQNKGIVKETGHFSFELTDKQGNIKSIPYSKLIGQTITKQSSNNQLIRQNIHLSVPSSLQQSSVKEKILRTIVNTPWSSPISEPFIDSFHKVDNNYEIDIVAFTLAKNHAENIKSAIEKQFA